MMNTKTKMVHYIAKAHAENTLPVVTNGSVDIAYGVGATVGIAMVLNDWADAEKAHADRIKEEGQKWAKHKEDIGSLLGLPVSFQINELAENIRERVEAHNRFKAEIRRATVCDGLALSQIVQHVQVLAKGAEHSEQRIYELEKKLKEATAKPVDFAELESSLRRCIDNQEGELNEYRNVMSEARDHLGLAKNADGTDILTAIKKTVAQLASVKEGYDVLKLLADQHGPLEKLWSQVFQKMVQAKPAIMGKDEPSGVLILEAIDALIADCAENFEIFQYADGKKEYRKLGLAHPAGIVKRSNVPPLIFYTCLETGKLYFRTVDDFNQRMLKVWERKA